MSARPRQHLLPSTLPDFSQATILVVGDVMLDRYWFGDTSRISPEAPVPVVKINQTDHRPGGAGNVALNIAALGAKVILLGLVGQDEAAHTLTRYLEQASVQHDLCQLETAATIIKLRVISRHQQLLRLDFEDPLHPQQVTTAPHDDLIKRYQQYLSQVDLVILSDYQKGALANPSLFIQLARSAGVPVLVDPKGADFNRYRNASILTPNLKEFEAITGRCTDEDDLRQKGQKLRESLGIDALLVTRGEDGMTLFEAQTITHLPAYAREVFDVTGAGDTVIALLGNAVALGIPLQSAMALANLAASIAIGKLGAATVSPTELQIQLTDHALMASGVYDEAQLMTAVTQARALGKKIIFTNGCFDVLHAGHVNYLHLAKQLGDYLIVAVNTDETIRELKGAGRPVNSLEQRMCVLAALESVDWVIPFADKTPERLLAQIQPDVLVKGGDYREDQIVGAPIVKAYGGEVRIVGTHYPNSSTATINKMHALAKPGELT